jgi:hypothetical protein
MALHRHVRLSNFALIRSLISSPVLHIAYRRFVEVLVCACAVLARVCIFVVEEL